MPFFFIVLNVVVILLQFLELATSSMVQSENSFFSSDNDFQLDLPLNATFFRCCAIVEDTAPYYRTALHRRPMYDGWTTENFRILQERAGFKCSKLITFKTEKKDRDVTSYNYVVDHIANCTDPSFDCKCDIGLGSFWKTESRLGVHFFPPHGIDNLVVVTRKDNIIASGNTLFFIKAFSYDLWLAILGTWILFLVLKLLDIRFAPIKRKPSQSNAKISWSNFKFNLSKTPGVYRLRKAVQSVVEKNNRIHISKVTGEDKSTRQWFLNLTIVFFGLITIIIYESAMTYQMVQESLESKYRTVEDLMECNRIPLSDICINKGDFTETFWDSLAKKRELKCNGMNGSKVHKLNTVDEAMNWLVKGDCQYVISDGGTARYMTVSKHCQQLELTGEPIFEAGVSFISKKGLGEKNELDNLSISLEEESTFQSLDDYIQSKFKCTPTGKTVIPFRTLKFFFILVYSVCCLLGCYMAIDRDWKSIRRRYKRKNEQENRIIEIQEP